MEKYDVIVVGGGGAGFCAAMRSAQLGKRVALLEKGNSIGGSAAMARGVGAVGARDQLRDPKGNFTAAQMLKDWMEQTNYLANYPIIRTFLKNSGRTVDWLQDLGCRLDYVGTCQKKHENSPFQTYFIWDTYKAGEMRTLISLVEEKGGNVFRRTAGTGVIMEDGAAAGVWAENSEGRFPLYGENVILCSGGYGHNEAMVLEATGGVKVNGINTGTQDGDGIRMGREAGGDTENLHVIEFHGCDSPTDKVSRSSIGGHGNELSWLTAFPGAVWLNRSGWRFVDESVCDDTSYVGNVTFRQGSEYYVLLDQAMVDALSERGAAALGVNSEVRGKGPDELWTKLKEQIETGLPYGICYRGDTLEDVAKAAGLPAEAVLDTVAEYNRCCREKQDRMYGKAPELLNPIEQGPFLIVEGRANQLCSLGGLRIDTSMRVLKRDRTPVPGLYAAGCDASGGLVNNAYVSYEGVTMGWACTSGLLAAEHAAGWLE